MARTEGGRDQEVASIEELEMICKRAVAELVVLACCVGGNRDNSLSAVRAISADIEEGIERFYGAGNG